MASTGAIVAVGAIVLVGGYVGYRLLNAQLAKVAATPSPNAPIRTDTAGKTGAWIDDASKLWGLGSSIWDYTHSSDSPTSTKGSSATGSSGFDLSGFKL